jgi:FkbM family methyltransferase
MRPNPPDTVPVFENVLSGLKFRTVRWLKKFPSWYAIIRSAYFGTGNGIAKLSFFIAEPVKYAIGDFGASHRRFVRDGANERVRWNPGLTTDSVVIDGGGYMGDWTAALIKECDPYVTIYEPVPAFCRQLAERFAENPKVTIQRLGMGSRCETRSFTIASDASGMFSLTSAESVQVRMTDVVREFERFERIDLLKLNIEGGEYEVLERLLETASIRKVAQLRVQFHLSVPGATARYRKISRRLKQTHRLVWRYPFVWEEWKLKDGTRGDLRSVG